MSAGVQARAEATAVTAVAPPTRLLRACDCGKAAPGRPGQCPACAGGKNPLGPGSAVTLGAPNDVYEQEADRIADRVMAGPAAPLPALRGTHQVQRQVAEEEELLQTKPETLQRQETGEEELLQTKAETLQRQADPQEEELIQPKATAAATNASAAAPAAAAAVRTGGQPLAASERAFFEPRFGTDLSHVRLHTDTATGHAAQSIGARAYTLGHHIGFAPGHFAPSTMDGRRLIAHELVHTLQQARGSTVDEPVVRRDVQPGRESGETAASPPPAVELGTARGDAEEMDFAFVFTGGAYGNAARDFISRYYPDHALIGARSFEAMFDTLYRRMRTSRSRGRDPHLRELIIVTHANAAGGLQIPLTRGTGRNPDGYFNPWSLAELQTDFRNDLQQRFRARRREVVAEMFDESTRVIVRGCEFGQAPEALDALRSFLGGDPYVWAPTGFQGFESIPIGGDLLPTPEAAFDFLMERDYLPPELQPLPEESKREFIARVFGLNGRIPAMFFVMGRDQYNELNRLIAERRGLSGEAEGSKERDETMLESVGEHWSLSAPGALGRPIPELDALSLDELEARGRALLANYRPEIAYLLVRLRQAWERKGMEVVERCLDSDDPICGLAPMDAFGDSNIVGPDASRFPGPTRDAFELTDIKLPEEQGETAQFEEGPAPGGEEAAPTETERGNAALPRPADGSAQPEPRRGAGAGIRPGRGRSGGPSPRAPGGRAAATDFDKSRGLAEISRPQAPAPESVDPQALIDALSSDSDLEIARAILGRMPEDGWTLSNYLSASELSISVATAPLTFIEGTAALFAIEAGGVVLGGVISIVGFFVSSAESREAQSQAAQALGVEIGYERLAGQLYRERINGEVDAAAMRENLTADSRVYNAIKFNIPHAGRTALPNIEIGVNAVADDANRVLRAADSALRQALVDGGLQGADLERAFEAARPIIRRRFTDEMLRQGAQAIARRRAALRARE